MSTILTFVTMVIFFDLLDIDMINVFFFYIKINKNNFKNIFYGIKNIFIKIYIYIYA